MRHSVRLTCPSRVRCTKNIGFCRVIALDGGQVAQGQSQSLVTSKEQNPPQSKLADVVFKSVSGEKGAGQAEGLLFLGYCPEVILEEAAGRSASPHCPSVPLLRQHQDVIKNHEALCGQSVIEAYNSKAFSSSVNRSVMDQQE